MSETEKYISSQEKDLAQIMMTLIIISLSNFIRSPFNCLSSSINQVVSKFSHPFRRMQAPLLGHDSKSLLTLRIRAFPALEFPL